MFETYEKPLQLESMQGQKGIVKFRYNRLFRTLTVKTYFLGKTISRETFPMKNEETLNMLLSARNKKVVIFKEWRKASGFGGYNRMVSGFDENNKIITQDFLDRNFRGYWEFRSREKIEKIIVKEKLKNA